MRETLCLIIHHVQSNLPIIRLPAIHKVTVYGKKDVRFTLSTGEEIQVD